MYKIFLFIFIFSLQVHAKRSIQSTYSGFTKSCVAFSFFEKKDHLKNYLLTIEQYAQEIDEKQLNKKIGSDTDEEAQLKLFTPAAFYQPQRVVGAYLNCYWGLKSFLSIETKKEGLLQLDSWVGCLQKLKSDSKEVRIALSVQSCMKQ